MADHSLDRQIGIDRLADDINTLKQQLSEMRTLQLQGANAVNLQSFPYNNIALPITAGGIYFINFYLDADSGGKVFAAPAEWTFYQGTRDHANDLINTSSNSYVLNWDVRVFRSTYLSDGNNVVDTVLVKNLTGGTLTFVMDVSWRYIIDSASGSL
jgi:hypothetical protein